MQNKRLTVSSSGDKKRVEAKIRQIRTQLQGKRKLMKLTQEAFAELLDVNVNTIKYIEQGRRVPSLELLIKICYKLGLDITIE